MRWVALLRGINVGGANRLPMGELRATVDGLGFDDVETYIQSGNLVFSDADGRSESQIAATLGRALTDRHALDVPVIVRSAADLAAVAGIHPDAGAAIDPRLLHVAFLDRAPDPELIAEVAPDAFDPDRWVLIGRELHLTYPDGSARSKMTIDRFERPWRVVATARNLNTVRRLVAMTE